MTKSKIVLACISIIWLVRYFLVENHVPTQIVSVTFRMTDVPVYTDSNTEIAKGKWTVHITGYHPLDLGKTYRFRGTITPYYFWGKPVRYFLTAESVEHITSPPPRLLDTLTILLTRLRVALVSSFERNFPSPMSNLASGLLLGVTGQMPKTFRDALINTGTLHIVAASGYNVTIVAQAVLALLIPFVGRNLAMGGSMALIVIFVLLAGGSPAVVRAGVMGVLTLIAQRWGRATQAKRLLWLAAGLMLCIDPLLIGNVGFQLSVAATAGILYGEQYLCLIGRRLIRNVSAQRYLSEYFYSTLAATVATMPILAWTFGRVSLIAPLVNVIVLPVVPLAMLMSFLALITTPIPLVSSLCAALAYVPLLLIVRVIVLVGSWL